MKTLLVVRWEVHKTKETKRDLSEKHNTYLFHEFLHYITPVNQAFDSLSHHFRTIYLPKFSLMTPFLITVTSNKKQYNWHKFTCSERLKTHWMTFIVRIIVHSKQVRRKFLSSLRVPILFNVYWMYAQQQIKTIIIITPLYICYCLNIFCCIWKWRTWSRRTSMTTWRAERK